MVDGSASGQQINTLQRVQGIILKRDIQSSVLGGGWGRGRGEGSVNIGVKGQGGAFWTIGRGGDEKRMIGHVEMGVVLGEL